MLKFDDKTIFKEIMTIASMPINNDNYTTANYVNIANSSAITPYLLILKAHNLHFANCDYKALIAFMEREKIEVDCF